MSRSRGKGSRSELRSRPAQATVRVDLHCHSTVSDGSETPVRLAERALAREVELFCLTDHDSADGFAATAEVLGDRALRGVELSCREDDHPVHLLLYQVAGDRWSCVANELAEVQRLRRQRVRDIAARLHRLGVQVDAEAIIAGAGSRAVGRPDVARALVAGGQVATLQEAFNRFLHDGGSGDVAIERLSVGDGLDLARSGGCRVALAHPHHLGATLARRLIRRHRGGGLEAIEAYYAAYSAAERRTWTRCADEEGLVVSAGSDFHGVAFPQITTLGIDLPVDLANRLCAWLEKPPITVTS